MNASGNGRGQEMARSTAILFGAASLITAVGLGLPHAGQVDAAGLAVVAAVAGAIALALAWWRERVPARAYPYLAIAGTILVSLGLFFNGERHGGPVGSDEMFYLWVTLWAAYYFTRRVLTLQVAVILAAYAVTLTLIHPGEAGTSRFISLGGLVVGAAIVVRMLSERSERLVAELREAALTDPLTGLANRRALELAFGREAAREARTGRPFTLLVIDLDRFKLLNDLQGHKAGDRALVEVAEVLREHARGVDVAARIGGDEFAVLLSDTGAPETLDVMRRLDTALSARAHAAGWPGAASFGSAVSDIDGTSMDALMRHADMRLYSAKREHHSRSDFPGGLREAS
jgi:diguanylate cyclase (GGDEF)-like protein